MKAPRSASLAAVVAVFVFLGCLPAAAEPAAAHEASASVRPVMAPADTAKKTASRKSASRRTTADSAHVYLFRGLLNVFSLGMDELADKIRASGIAATVYNHTEWEEVAGQIAANYKNGNRGPIILIGHSLGADAVMFMADKLGKYGVPVALVVPFDGTQTLVASSNIVRVLNLTQRDYAYARRGYGFHGELKNVDVSGEGVDHINIDKSPRLHSLVLSNIAAVVKKGEVPSSFATLPAEEKEKERAKPAPKPAPAELAAKPETPQEKPIAAKPAEETPKPESAPALRPSEAVPPPVPAEPAVSTAAAGSPSPASASAAPTATQPVAAPADSAPQPASAAPAKSAPIPATQRLEYEKLVLPKR
jgi:hypothetical protein